MTNFFFTIFFIYFNGKSDFGSCNKGHTVTQKKNVSTWYRDGYEERDREKIVKYREKKSTSQDV